jgi:replicative DNA helicase
MPPSNGTPPGRFKKKAERGLGDGDGLQRVGAVLSRTFPHSKDAEEGLLACCILEPDVVDRCMAARLTPDAFFFASHQVVFEALCTIYQKHGAVDDIVLAEELKTKGHLEEIGGLPFLNQLTNRVETPAHASHFLEIVREKFLLRRLIRTSSGTIEKCYNYQGGLDHFLEEVEQEIFKISEQRSSETAIPIKESVKEAYQLVQNLLERKGELNGISSGFIDLDKMTYGFHPAEMVILAARPSMGKTSLALNFAEAALFPKAGKSAKPVPCLIFSLEMSAAQLAMRMLCGRARVSMIRLRDGISTAEERQRLLAAADELSKAPLWIDDSGSLNIMEVRAKSRRLHGKHGLGMVVVDYLQLLSGTDSSVQREQQIAEISRGLKAMAKELSLPVIVLSQLNRESEKEKRAPRLSDLRESGSIEQDADVVFMLARPKDAGDEFQVAADRADLIIAKQRNGPVGTVPLTFIREITRFENYTGHPIEE